LKPIVAFQGEPGAYSEMAARAFFPAAIKIVPCSSFEDVFRKADSKPSLYGMIPIENSLTGSIHENYDLLLNHNAPIVGEIKLRISHALLAVPGTSLARIRRVYSHPQALAQCRTFLRKLRGVEVVPAYDTAGAVKMVREKNWTDAAAIGSMQAALDYGMRVLARSIESNKANYTRFLVLGRKPIQPLKPCKTSIVFAFKNVPGALFKCLGVFAMRDINLVKIESRPIHGKPWAYMFYLDFEGHADEERSRNAMNHLKEITLFLKVLGSYRPGREVEPKIVK